MNDQFDYLQWLQQQNMQRQQQQNPQMPYSPSPQQSGMVPSGVNASPQQSSDDLALKAILGIEALSPNEKRRAQMQAQADELRGMALGGQGVGTHWTGTLARGLAGGLSGYQQRKIEEQRKADAEERRRMMEQLGLGM